MRPGEGDDQRLRSHVREFVSGQLAMTEIKIGPAPLPTDQPPQSDLRHGGYERTSDYPQPRMALSDVMKERGPNHVLPLRSKDSDCGGGPITMALVDRRLRKE